MKIDTSSFSLTRIVTFMPFYMLVNRTKQSVFVCEEGQDNWTEAGPEQVGAKVASFLFHSLVFASVKRSNELGLEVLKKKQRRQAVHFL